MIVATAGHIDHGKTSLVRVLTGVDTDRLPEEKARGISIDLGFAHRTLPSGERVGFVDVPGHERFVRNMLAGVCGIDHALLVVAADDGVMPQTIEHVQILDLLGVRKGIAAITKCDRADPARVVEVRRDVSALLAPTSLSGSQVLTVSTVDGTGIAELQEALAAAAAAQAAGGDDGCHFRLAIDRSFTVGGSGTVVTGTVFSGTVVMGARVCVSPGGAAVRVRALRVHGVEVDRVHAGQRCALNLTGIDVAGAKRGHWICDPALHSPVRRVDARLRLLPGQGTALTAATLVHVHMGTGDEMARIAPLEGRGVRPGAYGFVQLLFDRPVSALHGDRFVVRDSAAMQTLGGGTVVDPFPPAHRRRAPERLALLAGLVGADASGALRAMLAGLPGGVDLRRFETAHNVRPDRATVLYRSEEVVMLGAGRPVGVARSACAAIEAAIEARLVRFHADTPTALGMREALLQRDTAPATLPTTFQCLLQDLAHRRQVTLGGGVARLPRHDASDNAADRALWERIYPRLLEAGALAPTVTELARDAGVDAAALRDVLFRRRATGAVHRVAVDRFYLRATMAAFAATAAAVCARAPDGTFTAGEFRDAVGTGRTVAIQVLEYLDGLRITSRIGDARRMQGDPVPILGEAAPIANVSRSAVRDAATPAPPQAPPLVRVRKLQRREATS